MAVWFSKAMRQARAPWFFTCHTGDQYRSVTNGANGPNNIRYSSLDKAPIQRWIDMLIALIIWPVMLILEV